MANCKNYKSRSDEGFCRVACRYCTYEQESRCKEKVYDGTTADRIRAMSDEKLAEALHKIFCDGMIYGLQSTAGDWHGAKKESDYLDWLQQPAEEG